MLDAKDAEDVPYWVIVASYGAMAFGTAIGGWRIVKTMGMGLTQLKPVGGFCAEIAGAITLFVATHLKIPVSTTHTITGAIVGVGSVDQGCAASAGASRRGSSGRGSSRSPRRGVVGAGASARARVGALCTPAPCVRHARSARRRDRDRRRPQRPRRRGPAREARAVGSPCSSGATRSAARRSPRQPWGPDYKMTALSYVVSLMPPTIVRRARARAVRLQDLPAAPVLRAAPDGRYLQMSDDPPRRRAADREVLRARRRRDRALGRLARPARPACSGRCSTQVPPRLGCKRPRDLLAALGARVAAAQARRARRRRRHAPVHDEHRRPARGVLRVRRGARRARRSAA